jgi:hypothetical protein
MEIAPLLLLLLWFLILNYPPLDCKWHGLRLRVPLATALRQTVNAVRVVAGHPLVTSLATDAVSRTELAEVESTGQVVSNEITFRSIGFSSRHGMVKSSESTSAS